MAVTSTLGTSGNNYTYFTSPVYIGTIDQNTYPSNISFSAYDSSGFFWHSGAASSHHDNYRLRLTNASGSKIYAYLQPAWGTNGNSNWTQSSFTTSLEPGSSDFLASSTALYLQVFETEHNNHAGFSLRGRVNVTITNPTIYSDISSVSISTVSTSVLTLQVSWSAPSAASGIGVNITGFTVTVSTTKGGTAVKTISAASTSTSCTITVDAVAAYYASVKCSVNMGGTTISTSQIWSSSAATPVAAATSIGTPTNFRGVYSGADSTITLYWTRVTPGPGLNKPYYWIYYRFISGDEWSDWMYCFTCSSSDPTNKQYYIFASGAPYGWGYRTYQFRICARSQKEGVSDTVQSDWAMTSEIVASNPYILGPCTNIKGKRTSRDLVTFTWNYPSNKVVNSTHNDVEGFKYYYKIYNLSMEEVETSNTKTKRVYGGPPPEAKIIVDAFGLYGNCYVKLFITALGSYNDGSGNTEASSQPVYIPMPPAQKSRYSIITKSDMDELKSWLGNTSLPTMKRNNIIYANDVIEYFPPYTGTANYLTPVNYHYRDPTRTDDKTIYVQWYNQYIPNSKYYIDLGSSE